MKNMKNIENSDAHPLTVTENVRNVRKNIRENQPKLVPEHQSEHPATCENYSTRPVGSDRQTGVSGRMKQYEINTHVEEKLKIGAGQKKILEFAIGRRMSEVTNQPCQGAICPKLKISMKQPKPKPNLTKPIQPKPKRCRKAKSAADNINSNSIRNYFKPETESNPGMTLYRPPDHHIPDPTDSLRVLHQ